jgi:MYXO-CTERM domain-containing protein
MRAWLAFLCVVAVCKLLELFAVSSDVGAESPPPPPTDARLVDAPLVDASPVDAPLPIDARPDAPSPDARPPDAALPDAPLAAPDARVAPDAPIAMTTDDGGCSCRAAGRPADTVQLLLVVAALAVVRRRSCTRAAG